MNKTIEVSVVLVNLAIRRLEQAARNKIKADNTKRAHRADKVRHAKAVDIKLSHMV